MIDTKSWDLPVQKHIVGDVAVYGGGKHKADLCYWLHSGHPDLTPVAHRHQMGGSQVSLASDSEKGNFSRPVAVLNTKHRPDYNDICPSCLFMTKPQVPQGLVLLAAGSRCWLRRSLPQNRYQPLPALGVPAQRLWPL